MRKVLHPEAEEKKRDRLQEMKAAHLEKSESEKGRTGLRTLASSFSSSFFFALCRHFQKSENAMSIALYFCFFQYRSYIIHRHFFYGLLSKGKTGQISGTKEESVNWIETERIFIASFTLKFHSEVSLWSVSESFQSDRKRFPHVLFRFFYEGISSSAGI